MWLRSFYFKAFLSILAEGAIALSVTLSGGALFASWKLLQFPSSLIVKVILAIFRRASAQQCHMQHIAFICMNKAFTHHLNFMFLDHFFNKTWFSKYVILFLQFIINTWLCKHAIFFLHFYHQNLTLQTCSCSCIFIIKTWLCKHVVFPPGLSSKHDFANMLSFLSVLSSKHDFANVLFWSSFFMKTWLCKHVVFFPQFYHQNLTLQTCCIFLQFYHPNMTLQTCCLFLSVLSSKPDFANMLSFSFSFIIKTWPCKHVVFFLQFYHQNMTLQTCCLFPSVVSSKHDFADMLSFSFSFIIKAWLCKHVVFLVKSCLDDKTEAKREHACKVMFCWETPTRNIKFE